MHIRSLGAYLVWPVRCLIIGLLLSLCLAFPTRCYGGEGLSNADLGLLQSAAAHIGQGRFEEGRSCLEQLDGPGGEDGRQELLAELLDQYEQVMVRVRDASQVTYDEYLDKMNLAIKTVHWREALLATSEAYPLDVSEKTRAEEGFRADVQDQWLKALAHLRAAHNLADRVGLTETLDPALRQAIIDQSLRIGERLEEDHDWLDAYGKVYYNFTELDMGSQQYQEHGDYLLRMALTTGMYAPDPNEDAIDWQERRRGITYDMFAHALRCVADRYVDPLDFTAMGRKALRNCLILTEAPKLATAFEQLNNEENASEFRRGLISLRDGLAGRVEGIGCLDILELLRDVLEVNNDSLELPTEVLVAEFAEGAFDALDGYTYVVWPADVETFRKDMTSEFSGIGVYISKAEGLLKIESLLDDSPAADAGLDAGDVIMAIDGKNTAHISIDMAVRSITGKAGTTVTLSVDREGFEEPREFDVTRRRIVVHTVKGISRDEQGHWQHFVDQQNGIAYIRLTSFADETAASLRRCLRQLKRQDMRALVLDLRRNSGGFLSTAIDVVDTFVSDGLIVASRSRDSSRPVQDFAQQRSTFDPQLPVVVLVDAHSASASEIVSGALQDHHRALVVGTRTFGKGNVQTIQKLRPSEAELKMTIAYYYLPSGRRVHKGPKEHINPDYGVHPDVKVELVGKLLEDWYKVTHAAGVLHRPGSLNGDSEWKTYSPGDVLENDPQLTIACICLQAQLLANELDKADWGQLVGPAKTKPLRAF